MSEYLFIQKYNEHQNSIQMEGTKEYPCFLIGLVKETGERFVTIRIPYNKDSEVQIPPFRQMHKWLHLDKEKVNLHYENVYVQGVMVNWEDENLIGDAFYYKIVW